MVSLRSGLCILASTGASLREVVPLGIHTNVNTYAAVEYTRFRALPFALLLATNCGLLDLLSEHPSCLMDSPAPPPGQVRLTQVGGGEIPVWNTLNTSEPPSPSKGSEHQ